MHIKKSNRNKKSISVLVKVHGRHLRIWLHVRQHKLPSENKAQLISESLMCLDENEFLIDLVVRGIMQEYEMAGHSRSALLWRCLLVASRQEQWHVFSKSNKEQCQAVTGRGSLGSWRDELPRDITISSLHSQESVSCNRPQTPSCICIPACFAIILQIISFTISQIFPTFTGK